MLPRARLSEVVVWLWSLNLQRIMSRTKDDLAMRQTLFFFCSVGKIGTGA